MAPIFYLHVGSADDQSTVTQAQFLEGVRTFKSRQVQACMSHFLPLSTVGEYAKVCTLHIMFTSVFIACNNST